MIVRPLIPQQSTVNGKRKVISRYEEGGEAAKTGIGNFAKQLRAYGERFPVYGIGSFGDIIDVAQQGFSKLPISPGYFLDKEVQTDPEVAQTLRNKANPLPTSEEVTSFLESKGVEFTDKEGVGDFIASIASPATLLALPSAIASAARQVPKLVEKIPEVMESLYARFPALDPKMYVVEPKYVYSGTKIGNIKNQDKLPSELIIDKEKVTTSNPSLEPEGGFRTFSHTVMLDIDDALKFHPNRAVEDDISRANIKKIKEQIKSGESTLDAPFIKVTLKKDNQGDLLYEYKGGQEGAHRLAAIKELIDEGEITSRKVPMNLATSDDSFSRRDMINLFKKQGESEKEFLDREGFSFLKDVKKVKGVTSDWDKKGRVKYDLDLETGKVSGKKNVLDAVSETPEQLRDLTKEMTERTRGKVEPFKFEEQKKVFAELREKTAKADARRAEDPNLMDIGDIFDENRKLYEQAADVAVDSKTFVENLDKLKKLRNKKNVDQEHLEDLIETLETFKLSKTFTGREKLAKKYTEENGFLSYVEKGRNEVLEPVSVYGTVPNIPRPAELLAGISHKSDTLDKAEDTKSFINASKKGEQTPLNVLGLNIDIPNSVEVSSRLDIPGYTQKGQYINTLTFRDADGVMQTVYAPITFLKNASFAPQAKAASNVVIGKKPKTPFSAIKGEFENLSVPRAQKLAEDILSGKEKGWTQVGFNPMRSGGYFNRANPEETVFYGEEMLQIGPLVLVKNAIKSSKPLDQDAATKKLLAEKIGDNQTEKFAQGQYVEVDGKKIKFKEGGEVSGVGTLNDTARNMFKQPRGVVTLSSVARNMFI